MAHTQDTEAMVKTAPLTHQVVECDSNGRAFVVAAFDRPEDAEFFASLRDYRRARVDPHWAGMQQMARELHRPATVTDELAGRDA